MALNVYKPGQGYWTRVMTAVGIGVLVLAAAAWAWEQAGTIRLPAESHNIAVRAATGADQLAAGDTITYLHPADDPEDPPVDYGRAVVESVTIGNDRSGTIVVGTFSNEDVRDNYGRATRLSAEGFEAQIASASANPIFPRNYLQAGAAGVVLVIGFVIIYWAAGFGRKTNEFLIATDGEMKKVNWSTRKEIIGSTWVVIISAFLIAGILFAIDMLFKQLFESIGVLES